LSFGGPAGQIALLHREVVERRRWVDEARFLHALNYCMLLPGPEAQQLATYIGWLLHGIPGGLLSGGLFILPGALLMLALSLFYVTVGSLPVGEGAFFGLKAAVLIVVLEAVQRLGRRALRGPAQVGVAAAAFVALALLAVPFPVVVLVAGVFGALWARVGAPPGGAAAVPAQPAEDSVVAWMERAGRLEHTRPNGPRLAVVGLVGLGLWAAPTALAWALAGPDSVYVAEGLFFSKAAVVTFGGAYSVLAYVADQAVRVQGWMQPGQMLDGLGLAETTPGPLILVVQFVGFLGAFGRPGGLPPLLAGCLGALLTTTVTFVPSFLWVLAGGPFMESLRGNRTLHAALSAITAAIVGVVLHLALWFALHVLFGAQETWTFGPLSLLWPVWGSFRWAAGLLTLGAGVAMLRYKVGMVQTLVACALIGALGVLLAPLWVG
jgi:chromate transporter